MRRDAQGRVGFEVLVGGGPDIAGPLFYQPSVVTGVRPDMEIVQEEIFGPVAALVRAIQTDTQDAVSAMARSTQGVVEGARLADTAGLAITNISKVSQELAEIILDIAHTTRGQADQAQTVAQAITQILSTTQKTTQGTRETAQSTEALAALAQELKKSVARFKVTV